MKNALHITSSFLGVYAGLLAMEHGIFETLQGSRTPDGLMIQAIGAPCRPDTAWHACYPAMTLIPSLLVTGVLAIITGLSVLIWAALFIQRKRGGLVLVVLSVSMLFVGGGFVPTLIGSIAGTAASRIDAPTAVSSRRLRFLAGLWPWTLILMALWVPGGRLLGHFFSQAMLTWGRPLFLFFDVILPALAAFSGYAHDRN
ncbi:MAG: hypothetical protein JXB07_10510 [Anaerolineae bacterium]|nr:hypothetical protein [Anaerolineae bacterium]